MMTIPTQVLTDIASANADDGWDSPEEEAQKNEIDDQIWEHAVERSRREYNGEKD